MVSEDILWREKQKTIKEKGSGEWGHLLRKKRLLQTKDSGEWGHTFGMKKKSLENGEDILEEKNKRLSKKKSLVSEDIYWKKKNIRNKRLWWMRTNIWDEKKSLTKGEWGHLEKKS